MSNYFGWDPDEEIERAVWEDVLRDDDRYKPAPKFRRRHIPPINKHGELPNIQNPIVYKPVKHRPEEDSPFNKEKKIIIPHIPKPEIWVEPTFPLHEAALVIEDEDFPPYIFPRGSFKQVASVMEDGDFPPYIIPRSSFEEEAIEEIVVQESEEDLFGRPTDPWHSNDQVDAPTHFNRGGMRLQNEREFSRHSDYSTPNQKRRGPVYPYHLSPLLPDDHTILRKYISKFSMQSKLKTKLISFPCVYDSLTTIWRGPYVYLVSCEKYAEEYGRPGEFAVIRTWFTRNEPSVWWFHTYEKARLETIRSAIEVSEAAIRLVGIPLPCKEFPPEKFIRNRQ